jgi:hypothetical protein
LAASVIFKNALCYQPHKNSPNLVTLDATGKLFGRQDPGGKISGSAAKAIC